MEHSRSRFPVEISGHQREFCDHVVLGEGVFPAAGYVQLLRGYLSRGTAISLSDLYWFRPLKSGEALALDARPDGESYDCRFMSEAVGQEEQKDYCTARVFAGIGAEISAELPTETSLDAHDAAVTELAASEIYDIFHRNGIRYLNGFRSISRIQLAGDVALGFVSIPMSGLSSELYGYDAAVQCALLHFFAASGHASTKVPFSLRSLRAAAPLPAEFLVRSSRSRKAGDGKSAAYDLLLFTADGKVLAQCTDLTIRDYSAPARADMEICVAATFTSEPIGEPLQNRVAQLGARARLRFAPYRQLLAQLLSPRTELITRGPGINIVLLGLEDFSNYPAADSVSFQPRSSEHRGSGHQTCTLPNGMEIAHLNSYETKYLYEEIFQQRVYERNGVVIRDGDTVIDVGANIGMFAMSVIARNPRCRVLALEPSPAAFEVLSANAQAHGRGNIVAARYGVWSTSGSRKLTYYPNSSVFSGFRTDSVRDAEALRAAISNALDARNVDAEHREELTRKFMEERLIKEEYDCPVRSLSDIMAEHPIQTVDLLKIDAEGSELEILSGISDDDWARIDQIVLEVHESADVACSDVCALLSSKGYNVRVHEESALAGSGLKNVYATRDVKPRNVQPTERFQNLYDFAACLEHFAESKRVHCIVGVSPPSPALTPAEHEEMVAALSRRLRNNAHVHFLSFRDYSELDVRDYYDETRDRVANIPYKPPYFDFMAATLSSVIAIIINGPRKVVALDADGTLWSGVCAEERAEDLRVNASLQAFMRDRAREGMLLCLVSKNNIEDVRRVFAAKPEMILKWSDFAAVRVNWSAKSANLTGLSAQLGLSLDSFVFLDDNPVECAEVRANCPQVLALCLPGERERVPALLERVCFFQNRNVTDEDGRRSRMYRESAQRERYRSGFGSLREYIESLRLEVTQEPISEESMDRVAQLTARTNQFNVRKVTRTSEEIATLLSLGYQGYVARVRDRFGDYGLTGAVIYQLGARAVRVDTFLLSCRVLGRGVEYELARRLGSLALEKKIETVIFDAVPTDRNAPALDFLSRLEHARRHEQGASVVFEFSSQYLAQVSFDPDRAPAVRADHGLPRKERREESGAAELEEAADTAAGEDGSDIAQYIRRVVRSVRDVPLRKLAADRPFAKLGIDSFSLVEILVRLEKDFGRLPGTLLFDCDTIDSLGEYFMKFHRSRIRELTAGARLAGAGAGLEAGTDSPQSVDLASVSRRAGRRLSYNQEAMWISHSTDQGALAYNVPLAITLRGEVDVSILHQSLKALVLRHEVLRTRFFEVAGVATCEVDESADIDLPILDLSHLEKREQDARVRALMEEESATRFDLAHRHPLRSKLVRLGRKRHLLLLTLHHLVSDGWSVRILFRDLAAFHDGFENGEASALEPLRHSYRDYVRWEEEQYQAGQCEQRLAHWKKALEGAPPLLRFPLDRTRGSHRTYASEVHRFPIPRILGQDLRILSAENNCSLYDTLLSGFALLLHLYSGQSDFVIGSPTVNRESDDVREMIGYFTNIQPVRARCDASMTFLGLLRQVSEWNAAAQKYKAVPFARLLEMLDIGRSANHGPLVQAVFTFQNTPLEAAALVNAHFSLLERVTVESQFELTVEVQDEREELSVRIEYLTDLFDRSTIERFAKHFVTLLEKLVIDPETSIHEYCLLSESERSQQLLDWNTTALPYPHEQCVHELFERQARLQPDAVALVHEGSLLTHGELNRRANRVARCLRDQGVGPEVPVGVCMERSPELAIGLLAILKAGGAYVPLDPEYPEARLDYMLAQSGCRVVLSEQHLMADLPLLSTVKVLPLDARLHAALFGAQSDANIEIADSGVCAANLAYVIYTSGSTGQPKGSAIAHRNISRLVYNDFIDYAGARRILCAASPSFDAFTFELWGAVLHGGCSVMVGGTRGSFSELGELVEREGVDCAFVTTALFNQLIVGSADSLRNLKCLLAGGEAASIGHFREGLRRLPRTVISNIYGPTENTTFSSLHTLVEEELVGRSTVPIGHPIGNTQAYVLGSRGDLVPVGVVGELYLGGAGLARGYLKRGGLTAEKFVPSAFARMPGERLYRTGDLVRYRPDGELEFIGRVDHQVKVRGFRIEPGEIENVLRQHEAVRETVVLVREDSPGERSLVAYVVAAEGVMEARELQLSLLEHLRGHLPDYMVPAAFALLDALPLTVNKKVDVAALPKPDESAYARATYEAPGTTMEKALAELWRENLGVGKVGIGDNYFSIGGDSIRSISLVAAAKRRGLRFLVKDLFSHRTIKALAQVTEAVESGAEKIPELQPLSLLTEDERTYVGERYESAAIEDAFPLSTLQQGLIYHSLARKELSTYHDILTYRIRERWNPASFERALSHIISRHGMLRTVFDLGASRPIQVVLKRVPGDIEIVDIADVSETSRIVEQWIEHERNQGIDLSRGLWKIRVHVLPDGEFVLGMSFHHALYDGWSNATFLNELLRTYKNRDLDESAPLSYRHFVALEQEALWSQQNVAYWRNKLEGARLPWWTGDLRELSASFSHEVPEDSSNKLRALAATLGTQEKSVWTAVYLALISLLDGSNDAVASVATHGRPEMSGSEKTLGLFVNSLPARVDLTGMRWKDLILAAEAELQALQAVRHFPLVQIQALTGMDFSAALLNFVNFHIYEENIADRQLILSDGFEETNYCIMFQVQRIQDLKRYVISVRLDPSVFDQGFRDRIHGYVVAIIDRLIGHANERIDKSSLLGATELTTLLATWNATGRAYPDEKCIQELFEEQARVQPDAVALVHEDSQLSYGELNRRANAVAHQLIERGVGPEVRVGVCLERSAQMVVAILAVLKAGACYVPMDPRYPQERLRYIETDAGVALVLTQSHLRGLLCATPMCVDAMGASAGAYPEGNPSKRSIASNLAYVIYTSGSTGKPKGVGIQHQSALSFLTWAGTTYGRDRMQSVLASTSICFDLSVYELFGPLSVGGECVLIEDILSLDQSLAQERVRLLNTVPSAIKALLSKNAIPAGVRTINLAGERLVPQLVDELYELGTVTDVHDLYGPSEATTYSTQVRRSPQGVETIGRPVANTSVHVLREGTLVPTGVAGEIFVGGEGLARGYLGRAALTAERFVPDPFSDKVGARLYRTGDLGRHLPDGSLEYLGRLDQQVKLRGYRIELGEIESALRHHGDLRETVVVAHGVDRDSTQLVAYVVPKPSVEAGIGEVATEEPTDVVAQEWRRVFDEELYRAAAEREPASGSQAKNWFDGWVSSYDRSPLGLEEMQVWADLAVARIRSLEPQDLLEVGCGLGLLALRLLPDCRSYVGSDFSRSALDALAANVPAEQQSRLQLHCCEAKDFEAYQGQQFDAIILNSVVQYFPDVEYLLQTLAGALRHVRPGGAVFLGDVRNYELLAAFATSLELSKEAARLDIQALRAGVNARLAKENELLVSPRFFEQLKGRFPQITHVELLPKYDFSHQGLDNELFRYRYDVVLTVAGKTEEDAAAPAHADAHADAVIDWRARGFDAEYFRSELAAGRQTLCMTHVPDTRLSKDLRIFGLLQVPEADRKASLHESMAREDERNAGGVAMDAYIAMAEEYGYRADVSLVGELRGEYGLHLCRLGQVRAKSVLVQVAENVDLRSLASDPMRGRREAGLKSRLRDFLKERLPEHMVPAAFVVLPQLPLNANGKVDRKALPPPDNSAFAREVYVSASSRRERVLVEIWERVLNASRVGVKDNFFALGGDSILSIQVVSQAKSRGFGLSTKAIFEHPTIESLAAQMVDEVQAIPQRSSQGELTLLPIQRVFFRDNPQAVHHYHQSMMVCAPERFELTFLRAFVAAVYDRHDALRLRFAQRDGQWKGTYRPVTDEVISASLVECDLGALSQSQREASMARVGQSTKESIEINRGPLLRAVFFRADDWRHSRLLLVIHHLVVDGVSWRILLNDLEQAFGQWSAEKVIRLSPKTHGVDVWTQRLAAQTLEEEKSYWISRLSGDVPSLPVDGEVPADDIYGASDSVRVQLSAALTGALLNSCHHAYRTRINDLLLSGLFLAVCKWTGQQALRISLEGHGREELFEAIDVSQTVGWFTSLFPLTLRLSPAWRAGTHDSLQELIRTIKEELRTLPHNGIGYGVLRHLAADDALLQRDEPNDILFNYLGQFDSLFHGSKSFSSASQDTGANVGPKLRRTHKLLINSVVQDGRLCFEINFNPRTYARATVERFGGGLEESLQEIVSHCRQQQHGRFSPSDFPLVGLQQGEIDDLQERYPRLVDCYGASGLQSGLIFHALTDEGEGGEDYTVQVYLTLEAQIDVARFKDAWERVAERHDCFRSAFTGFERNQILQVVLERVELPWTEMDWRDKSDTELLTAFEAYARAERGVGFEFATAPLMRFALIREKDARYRFLWTHHHSLLDGWSLGSVLGEVIGYYSGLPASGGTGAYKDYLTWLRSRDRERAREFWTQELQAAERRGALSLRRPALGSAEVGTQVKTWRLSARQTRAIEALARHHKVTMNVVLLASWAYLLSRYSGSDTVMLGQTVSGRDPSIRHVEEIVGLLIRTIPVCVEVPGSLAIGEWLTRLHARSVERERYSYYPLPEIRQCSGLSAAEALFESLLVFENYPIDERLQNAVRTGASLPIGLTGSHETTNYDLTLLVIPGSELRFKLSYRAQRFAQESIEQLMRHFFVVLEGMTAGKYSTVSQLPLLSVLERQQQLVEWNATGRAYPDEKCIQELFEEQARVQPDAVALVHEDSQLSYGELNRRANAVAHQLIERGVGPEVRVGVCLERSAQMVIGMLGILKAGGAYVPLDPSYPRKRLEYLVGDSAVELIVSQRAVEESLELSRLGAGAGRGSISVVSVDPEGPGASAGRPDNPVTGVRAANLAYVIYTSGSTGQPKGVGIAHGSAVSLLGWCGQQWSLAERAGVLASTSICFDLSIYELFVPLTQGGQCVLIESILGLSELGQRERVSLINTVPSAAKALLEKGGLPGSVRVMNLAGEPLKAQLVDELYRSSAATRIYDLYGPSEGTTYSTYALRSAQGRETIGRPVANTQAYVVDGEGELLPSGVVGELHLGGVGLSRGYLNRPGLTAQKFIPHRFSGEPGERLYRTGDLVRWVGDGTLEYLGRVDHQVKVRGYRIELGEIESVLRGHAAVRDAVVVAREEAGGGKRLVGYVVGAAGAQANAAASVALVNELRGRLQEQLPGYMVPSTLMVLESLPLTANGKLDRNALPAPDGEAYAHRQYEAPQGEIEQALAQLWQELLRIERVGRHDNFFVLGGHSLLAVTLIARLRQQGLRLEVRALFSFPTLMQLAGTVVQEGAAVIPANRITAECDRITPQLLPLVELEQEEIDRIVERVPGGVRNVQDIYPLAPLQEGILFHHLMSTQGDAYLIPMLLAFDTRQRLERFLTALQAVVARHDTLRTAVHWEGVSQPVQVVRRVAQLAVEEVELPDEDAALGEEAAQALWQRFDPRHYRLDVREAPLQKAFVAFDRQQGRWLLLLLSHHLAFDHTALEVIFAEVQAYLLGEPDRLATPTPFREFVARARRDVGAAEHEEFFRRMLADIEEPTAPFGWLDVRGEGGGIAEGHLGVEEAVARRIRRCAQARGVSAASVFHLAWGQVLARLTNREEVVFGTVLFGRSYGGAGAAQGVGLFINTLPLRLSIGQQSAQEALRSTHEQLGQLLRHEHASLALAQRCSGVLEDAPLFTTLLNYRYASSGSEPRLQVWEGMQWLRGEERTNYPLMLSVDDLGRGFRLTAQVRDQLDPRRLCELMHDALAGLVEALEEDAQRPIRTLSGRGFLEKTALLSDEERQQQLVEWNATGRAYPDEKCIQELFEEQARVQPDAVALVHEDSQLSYGELNRRANAVAHQLIERGVGPEVRVGVCLERSAQMVIGMLGILKAGGAYVPLDPSYPRKRLEYLVGDSAVELIVSQRAVEESLELSRLGAGAGRGSISVVSVDPEGPGASAGRPDNPVTGVRAANLAYVIYTSGSTGQPKGVGIAHGSAVSLLGWCGQQWSLAERAGVLASTSICFDLSIYELFVPLTQGGQCVLIESILGLSELGQRERVSLINTVPSAAKALLEKGGLPGSVRVMNLAGEPLKAQLVDELYRSSAATRIYDLYGPSEGTTYSTYALRSAQGRETIGRPVANTQAYVVDGEGELLPSGVVGELHLGGVGLSRGYLNRPGLTAQKFIPHRFSGEPGERLYRTGDLVRWVGDGTLEYLGRADHQVKVRGYRIELGEIESVLRGHAAVRDAVVVAREEAGGGKRLVGYVVGAAGAQANAAASVALVNELRGRLQEQLPGYMVPSTLMVLESLPLTANGKLDRNALPAPDESAQAEYAAPEGLTEELLAQLWSALLKRERVGRHDHFFELGGHSLLAMQLVSRIRETFSTQLPVREVFEHATLSSQARAVERARGASVPVDLPMEPVPRNEPLPLSHAQQRMLFLHEYAK